VRDLVASLRSEVDSLTPLESLTLAAAAAILTGLAYRVHLAIGWRQGFRAGRASSAIPSPTAEPSPAPPEESR
jgi:hypothetical protein